MTDSGNNLLSCTSVLNSGCNSSLGADGGGGGKERLEFFIVTRTEDEGWGGIQSQEEMSAFFQEQDRCSAVVWSVRSPRA